jgi:hypothetical protein
MTPKPAIEFICRRDAAKRAGVDPQLIDYWAKKHPDLLKHYGEDGRMYVAAKALDAIVALRAALKGPKIAAVLS